MGFLPQLELQLALLFFHGKADTNWPKISDKNVLPNTRKYTNLNIHFGESRSWISSLDMLQIYLKSKKQEGKMDKKRTLSSGKKCSRKLKSYNCCCLSKTSWKRNGRQSEKETWDELWNSFSFSFSFPLQGNCFHQAVQNIRAHADSILLEFVTNCCWAVLNFTIMCKNWFWR